MRRTPPRGMLTEHICSGWAGMRGLWCTPMERPPRMGRHNTRPAVAAMAGLAVAGLALSAVAVAVALGAPGPGPHWLAALTHALVIAAPIGAGLYAIYAQPASAGRFGRLLVISGFLWAPTLLAESADSVLYSVGRVSAWLAEGLLVYVVLAYPSGRLSARADKLLVRVTAVTVGVLFVPSALFV